MTDTIRPRATEKCKSRETMTRTMQAHSWRETDETAMRDIKQFAQRAQWSAVFPLLSVASTSALAAMSASAHSFSPYPHAK